MLSLFLFHIVSGPLRHDRNCIDVSHQILGLFVTLKQIQASFLLPSDRAIFLVDISDPLSLPALHSDSIIWILISHFCPLIDLPIGSIVLIPLNLPMFRD